MAKENSINKLIEFIQETEKQLINSDLVKYQNPNFTLKVDEFKVYTPNENILKYSYDVIKNVTRYVINKTLVEQIFFKFYDVSTEDGIKLKAKLLDLKLFRGWNYVLSQFAKDNKQKLVTLVE